MKHPYVAVLEEIKYQLILIQKRRSKQPWINYKNPVAIVVENDVERNLLIMANVILSKRFFYLDKIQRNYGIKVPNITLEEEIDLISKCIINIKQDKVRKKNEKY